MPPYSNIQDCFNFASTMILASMQSQVHVHSCSQLQLQWAKLCVCKSTFATHVDHGLCIVSVHNSWSMSSSYLSTVHHTTPFFYITSKFCNDIHKLEFKNVLFNLRAKTNGGLLITHLRFHIVISTCRCEEQQLRVCNDATLKCCCYSRYSSLWRLASQCVVFIQ